MSYFNFITISQLEAWLHENSFQRHIGMIQNHHTYMPSYAQFTGKNHLALLLEIEQAYLKRGFNKTGQHITTFPDGTLAIGRSFDIIPAGIAEANLTGLCIEHLGNFNDDGDEMTETHKKAIIKINALLCSRFNINPTIENMVYHHWYDRNSGKRTNGIGATEACPGNSFFGGNTIEDAEQNFIPLIKKSIATLESYSSMSQQ